MSCLGMAYRSLPDSGFPHLLGSSNLSRLAAAPQTLLASEGLPVSSLPDKKEPEIPGERESFFGYSKPVSESLGGSTGNLGLLGGPRS